MLRGTTAAGARTGEAYRSVTALGHAVFTTTTELKKECLEKYSEFFVPTVWFLRVVGRATVSIPFTQFEGRSDVQEDFPEFVLSSGLPAR
jgi:hypothetical protein